MGLLLFVVFRSGTTSINIHSSLIPAKKTLIHSYPRFIELITFFPHIQYQDKRTPEDSQTIMPPLIPKLGTVPALFGQAKQKQKAKQSSSQPRALPRTQAPDPIAIDLARDQRQQCCLYLLQRVMETQLRRAEQSRAGRGAGPKSISNYNRAAGGIG